MFGQPDFELWAMIYTAIGAMVLWGKLGTEKRKIFVLSDVIDQFGLGRRLRICLELSLFVIIACIVSAGIVHPSNAAQALAAGMGWTGLLSVRSERNGG